ncbi:MAG TPA: 2-amino-4-hydroxy-6-hydroxymethyldihydropteridine diphosphokinase, partial [Flavobacteriaceae bacterium]|nr:2-amino-4-hydroxy-6-hydroxymethyldihydropteridine diphosphokinase [Flavobacteriaceae bacterium]
MLQFKTVHIALGSNQGNKFENLQQAITAVHRQIGTVKRISKVYQTEAMGFTGDFFLNACIRVKTHLKPEKLLKKINAIEKNLGRERDATAQGYQSRTIDIDILLYADEIHQTDTLTLPHPEMHKRLFVLQPLQEIAPEAEHPVFNQTVTQLKNACTSSETLQPQNIWLKNPSKEYNWNAYNFIAIEGNIGAGKTSLATLISEDFNAKLILERFADNPFLPKFYKEPQRYAFTLEMSFLADRYQQISDDLSQLDLFKDFVVSDYDVHKSLIFSKVTLPDDEFKLYRKLFYQVYKDIAKPDLYVYLYQNTERLKQNIKKRGRNYEQNIQDEYLNQINAGYLEFLKSQPERNIKL